MVGAPGTPSGAPARPGARRGSTGRRCAIGDDLRSAELPPAARSFVDACAALPAACLLVDAAGAVRWVNAAFRAMVGLGEADGGGIRLPPRAAGFAERGADVLAGGRSSRVERIGFRLADGAVRCCTGVLVPLPSDGEPLVAGCFLDMGRHADLIDELDRLLTHTPVFVLCTDTDLRYTWTAGGALERLAEGAALGTSAWEVFGTDDPGHPVVGPLLAALEGRDTRFRAEFCGLWLDHWVGPLREGDGRVVGTIAVVVDTSEPEAARVRERVAEERLRRLIDHSPALIGVRDGADRVVHANPAYLRTFDQRPGADGRADVVPRGGSTDLTAVGREVREHLRSRIWEGRLPHAGGSPVDLMGYVFPMPMLDGRTGVGEVFLDVTGQERSRRALAEAEQRWRAVFDGAEVSIMLLDVGARILDVNAASTRFTGRPRSELVGRFIGAVTTRDDVTAHLEMWEELMAGRRTRYDAPFRFRHADGGLTAAQLTMALIRDSAGRPVNGLAMAVPVSGTAARLRADRLPNRAEGDVLRLLAAGLSIGEIGRDLGLTRRGVDYRIGRLRHKLRADGPDGVPATSAALVARAYTLGILVPAAWPPRLSDAGSPPRRAPGADRPGPAIS